MFKRFMLIGLLCIGLVALLNTEATSRCRIVDGHLKCSDICADTFLKGVGNPSVNTVAVCVGLYVEKVTGRCWNKPGNSGQARGTAFFPELPLIDETQVFPYHLTDERGSATVPLCWDWNLDIYDSILDWIYDHFTEVCPNYNWYFDEGSLKIDTMYVYHSAYEEDRNGNLVVSSQLCRKCYNGGTECGFTCSNVSISQCTGRGLGSACNAAVP